MPLVQTVLEGKFIKLASKPNDPITAAKNLTNTIISYWEMGMSDKGGKVNASACKGPLLSGLISATSSPSPSLSITAQAMGTVIASSALLMIISGGAHGTGGVTAAPPGKLIEGLKKAMKPSKNSVTGPKNMAKAIHEFTTKDVQIWGTGVPSAFIPPGPKLQ